MLCVITSTCAWLLIVTIENENRWIVRCLFPIFDWKNCNIIFKAFESGLNRVTIGTTTGLFTILSGVRSSSRPLPISQIVLHMFFFFYYLPSVLYLATRYICCLLFRVITRLLIKLARIQTDYSVIQ